MIYHIILISIADRHKIAFLLLKDFVYLVKPHVEHEHGVFLPTTNKNQKQSEGLADL